MSVRIIENIPLHQGSSGFAGHQNCSNRACGDGSIDVKGSKVEWAEKA
jgi:hypothetical protein